jgi:hypothetical protein
MMAATLPITSAASPRWHSFLQSYLNAERYQEAWSLHPAHLRDLDTSLLSSN